MVAGRPEKWTKEVLDKIAEEFIEWAKDDDNLTLRKFASRYVKDGQWLCEMAGKNEKFAEALHFSKNLIGIRREEKAISGEIKGDTGVIRATMATYDPEYKATLIEMKKAGTDKGEAAKAPVVNIISYKDGTFKVQENTSEEQK